MKISSPRGDARIELEELLICGVEGGLVEDVVIAESSEQQRAFWSLRESIAWVQRFEGSSIKRDVSVPLGAVPDFLAAADEAVTRLVPGSRPYAFGHLGDGNIHYNVSQPPAGHGQVFLGRWNEVHDAVHGVVARLGGSISAEHGIGVMKRDELPKYKDPTAFAIMRNLKTMFDPLGILNPGKVI